MEFTSLWFVTLFLPCSLLIYAATPQKGKNLVLLLLSLLFYSQLEVFYLFFMLASVTIDYLLSRLMQHYDNDNNRRRMMLILSMVKNIGIALVAGTGYELNANYVPVGMYVYLFSALGYLIDVYKGDEVYEKNYIRFALYCTMFPRIVAGPLFSYNHFRMQLSNRKFNLDRVSRGFCLFVFGFAKQILLLPGLKSLTQQLMALYPDNITVLSAWVGLFCVVLCYYYAFSSWCEMAQGLGTMFGFQYPSGFDYPLAAGSIYDFQTRFHGSVTAFVRKYVSVQLSADPNGMASAVFNLLISSVLIAMWYSTDLNGIGWGLFLGILVVLEQCALAKYLKVIPIFFRRIFTWLLLLYSFLLLINPGNGFVFSYLRSMAGIATPFKETKELYLIGTNWLVFVASVVFSMPVLRPLHRVLSLPPINRRQEGAQLAASTLLLRGISLVLAMALLGLSVLVLL